MARKDLKTMYIIVGYTSDIDINAGTARIRYLCGTNGNIHFAPVEERAKVLMFYTRQDADEYIAQHQIPLAISYGITR